MNLSSSQSPKRRHMFDKSYLQQPSFNNFKPSSSNESFKTIRIFTNSSNDSEFAPFTWTYIVESDTQSVYKTLDQIFELYEYKIYALFCQNLCKGTNFQNLAFCKQIGYENVDFNLFLDASYCTAGLSINSTVPRFDIYNSIPAICDAILLSARVSSDKNLLLSTTLGVLYKNLYPKNVLACNQHFSHNLSQSQTADHDLHTPSLNGNKHSIFLNLIATLCAVSEVQESSAEPFVNWSLLDNFDDLHKPDKITADTESQNYISGFRVSQTQASIKQKSFTFVLALMALDSIPRTDCTQHLHHTHYTMESRQTQRPLPFDEEKCYQFQLFIEMFNPLKPHFGSHWELRVDEEEIFAYILRLIWVAVLYPKLSSDDRTDGIKKQLQEYVAKELQSFAGDNNTCSFALSNSSHTDDFNSLSDESTDYEIEDFVQLKREFLKCLQIIYSQIFDGIFVINLKDISEYCRQYFTNASLIKGFMDIFRVFVKPFKRLPNLYDWFYGLVHKLYLTKNQIPFHGIRYIKRRLNVGKTNKTFLWNRWLLPVNTITCKEFEGFFPHICNSQTVTKLLDNWIPNGTEESLESKNSHSKSLKQDFLRLLKILQNPIELHHRFYLSNSGSLDGYNDSDLEKTFAEAEFWINDINFAKNYKMDKSMSIKPLNICKINKRNSSMIRHVNKVLYTNEPDSPENVESLGLNQFAFLQKKSKEFDFGRQDMPITPSQQKFNTQESSIPIIHTHFTIPKKKTGYRKTSVDYGACLTFSLRRKFLKRRNALVRRASSTLYNSVPRSAFQANQQLFGHSQPKKNLLTNTRSMIRHRSVSDYGSLGTIDSKFLSQIVKHGTKKKNSISRFGSKRIKASWDEREKNRQDKLVVYDLGDKTTDSRGVTEQKRKNKLIVNDDTNTRQSLFDSDHKTRSLYSVGLSKSYTEFEMKSQPTEKNTIGLGFFSDKEIVINVDAENNGNRSTQESILKSSSIGNSAGFSRNDIKNDSAHKYPKSKVNPSFNISFQNNYDFKKQQKRRLGTVKGLVSQLNGTNFDGHEMKNSTPEDFALKKVDQAKEKKNAQYKLNFNGKTSKLESTTANCSPKCVFKSPPKDVQNHTLGKKYTHEFPGLIMTNTMFSDLDNSFDSSLSLKQFTDCPALYQRFLNISNGPDSTPCPVMRKFKPGNHFDDLDVDSLVSETQIQKTIVDVKLGNVASRNSTKTYRNQESKNQILDNADFSQIFEPRQKIAIKKLDQASNQKNSQETTISPNFEDYEFLATSGLSSELLTTGELLSSGDDYQSTIATSADFADGCGVCDIMTA